MTKYHGTYPSISLFSIRMDIEVMKTTGICKHCSWLLKKGKDIFSATAVMAPSYQLPLCYLWCTEECYSRSANI